jgi:Holliday junction DNA helicase RuvA
MIARLRGEVVESSPGRVVLDVGGVGYDVAVPAREQPQGQATLHVHTDVREDAIVLFGFATMVEKEAFLLLRGVDGVGPRTALAVLTSLPPGPLAAALNAGDLRVLTGVPGIGKKLAERLVLELKGKLVAPAAAHPSSRRADDGLALALAQLGYKRAEIEAATAALADARMAEAPLADRVTFSLQHLSRAR